MVVLIGATVALALLFALHVYHWHFPDRIEGAFGEWPLLAGALALGLVAALVLPRLVPRLAAMRAATGAVAALVAFLILQAADPFVRERSWRYAPAGCDFAVSFPRRAEIVAGEARLAGQAPVPVRRAVYTNVGQARTLSAECVALERAPDAAARRATLAAAEEHLNTAAARLRLKIERLSGDGRDGLALSGWSDEGRTAENAVLVRRAEARVVLGRASLIVLWGWRLEREGAQSGDSPLAGLEARPREKP